MTDLTIEAWEEDHVAAPSPRYVRAGNGDGQHHIVLLAPGPRTVTLCWDFPDGARWWQHPDQFTLPAPTATDRVCAICQHGYERMVRPHARLVSDDVIDRILAACERLRASRVETGGDDWWIEALLSFGIEDDEEGEPDDYLASTYHALLHGPPEVVGWALRRINAVCVDGMTPQTVPPYSYHAVAATTLESYSALVWWGQNVAEGRLRAGLDVIHGFVRGHVARRLAEEIVQDLPSYQALGLGGREVDYI